MSKPINLNQHRKARAKVARRLRGDENAAKFGRSKSEKALEEARTQQRDQSLDGHNQDP